jgi:uncharacterized protein (DUF433 family)
MLRRSVKKESTPPEKKAPLARPRRSRATGLASTSTRWSGLPSRRLQPRFQPRSWAVGCMPWLGTGLFPLYYSRHGGIPITQLSQVLHSDPGILGGTPVFVGTRVPVQSLFDYLEGGETLDEFLRQFPSVKREQAIAALDLARDSLLAGARSS